MKYANVVFLQDSEADEALDILRKKGEKAAIKYLQNWDDNDANELSDEPQAGTSDSTFEHKGYLLTYNENIGYIGLERMVNE